MDVWFIYFHNDITEPYLYAVTDKKHLKDSFIEERKKKNFVCKKQSIGKDSYRHYLRDHHSYNLVRRGFETQPASKDQNIGRSIVYITTTEYEEMSVFTKEDIAMLEVAKYTHSYAKLFNKKILHALDLLHYFELYKFKTNREFDDDYFVRGVDTQWLKNNVYKIDSFGVFLILFGYTLDKKGLIKDEIKK